MLLLLRRWVMLLAAADSDAGLMELRQTWLQLLGMVVVVRLEMMSLLGMKSEVMPVAKQRHLDNSGPVKARLALEALALEGFHGAVRTPMLSAHLRGAGPFIRGLHLSLHPCQVSRMVPGRYTGVLARQAADDWGDLIRHSPLSGSVSPHTQCEGWANLLTSRHSNPQSGAPTRRFFQWEIEAGLARRCLFPL